MVETATNWIGGGVVAAIVVPIAASIALAVAQAVGGPVGELRELPTMMIVLWGPVLATIMVAPVAFVLGALMVRREERLMIASPTPLRSVVRRAAGFIAVGGALWGAVLATVGTLGGPVGWLLVPVGAVAGAIGGALAAWVVFSESTDRSHAT